MQNFIAMIIYKVTNLINGEIYIGLTTTSLKKRWITHKAMSKRKFSHLYNAMKKYGIHNFSIEQIDSTDDFVKLGELERYYIKLYNSQNPEKGYNITAGGESNQLDANPRASLTLEEVIQIRMLYDSCDIGCKECWKMFANKISYSAFEKVYEGQTWASVLPEVYTEENKKLHSKFKSHKSENNGNALYSNTEVLEIRKYYVSHSLTKTFQKFGIKSKSLQSFRNIIDRGYKNIPVYSKTKKVWILDNTIIDINNFNPVSTISVSGE